MEQNNSGAQKEMPRYKSHKKIWALKIKSIDGNRITPEETGQGIISVTDEYLAKHQPQVGGYYVMYEDGYKSFSPADAFEKGNTLISSSGLNFGDAIAALEEGKRVARSGWNGKNMWLSLSKGTTALPAKDFWSIHNRNFAEQNGGTAHVLPSITMKTADDKILIGWLASQSDMLAKDWCIVE